MTHLLFAAAPRSDSLHAKRVKERTTAQLKTELEIENSEEKRERKLRIAQER